MVEITDDSFPGPHRAEMSRNTEVERAMKEQLKRIAAQGSIVAFILVAFEVMIMISPFKSDLPEYHGHGSV